MACIQPAQSIRSPSPTPSARPPVSRERQADPGLDSSASSPSQPLGSGLSLDEKQEDADNQKNSSRAGQAGLSSNAVHIPVTVTAPPGDTTIIPSELSLTA